MVGKQDAEPTSDSGLTPPNTRASWTVRLIRRFGRLHDDSDETKEKIVHAGGGVSNAAGELLMAAVPGISLSALDSNSDTAWGMAIGLLVNAGAHLFGEELGTEQRLKLSKELGIRGTELRHVGHGHGHGHGHHDPEANDGDRRISKFAGKAAVTAQLGAATMPLASLVGTPMFGPPVAIACTAASVLGLAALSAAVYDPHNYKSRRHAVIDKLKRVPLWSGIALTLSEGVQPLVTKSADLASTTQQPLLWVGGGLLAPYVAGGAVRIAQAVKRTFVKRKEQRRIGAQSTALARSESPPRNWWRKVAMASVAAVMAGTVVTSGQVVNDGAQGPTKAPEGQTQVASPGHVDETNPPPAVKDPIKPQAPDVKVVHLKHGDTVWEFVQREFPGQPVCDKAVQIVEATTASAGPASVKDILNRARSFTPDTNVLVPAGPARPRC